MRVLVVGAIAGLLAFAPLGSGAQPAKPDPHHPPPAAGVPAKPPGGGGGMMGGGMMPGGMMSGGMMQHGAMMSGGMMGGMLFQHVEGRLAFLKAELKITPAQETPWSKFADAVRTAAKNAQAAMKPMMQGGAQPQSAVDQMARQERALAVRLDATRLVKAAFEPLYAALDDEQKKLADTLVGHAMGMK